MPLLAVAYPSEIIHAFLRRVAEPMRLEDIARRTGITRRRARATLFNLKKVGRVRHIVEEQLWYVEADAVPYIRYDIRSYENYHGKKERAGSGFVHRQGALPFVEQGDGGGQEGQVQERL